MAQRAYTKKTPFGAFAFDEKGRLLKKKTFSVSPKKFLEGELEEIMFGDEFEPVEGSADKSFVKQVFNNYEEFSCFMNDYCVKLTKLKIKKSHSLDEEIIQLVEGIEDINHNVNTLYERLLEWYGIHYPEALSELKGMDRFFKTLSENPKRSNVSEKVGAPKSSMGYDKVNIKLIQKFSAACLELLKVKEKMQGALGKDMEELAPNLSKVATPLVGAKLISIAGSLKKLARMSSSTVQVLGAEKALFRHLRTGAKPPKHGVILQHPFMQKVGRGEKGRMARALASKIVIAAKVDYYGEGRDVSDRLINELKEKME